MKQILFYAATSKFTIGDVTSVIVRTNRKLLIEKIFNYEITEAKEDEYGDITMGVRIPITERENWPVMRFRLLNIGGNTGFDQMQSDERYLIPFVHDAYNLVGQAPYLTSLDLMSFGEKNDFIRGPLALSSIDAPVPCPIIFHGSDFEKLKEYWSAKSDFSGNKEPEFWVSSLLDCLKFCKFITIWSFGYGTNPVVLSHSMSTVIAQIKEEVVKSGLSISETLEHDLPEW
jgi:hypothetical protein